MSGEAAASLGVLRVLVVEDEPIAAEAHTAYVERVPGFVVAATVGTSQAALHALQEKQVDVVRSAVSLGVVQYVLKPFVFATLRERLLAYRAYREQVQGADQVGTQAEVDQVIGGLRASAETPLPKGMSEELLSRVSRALREAVEGISASELGDTVGVSRVTARRYAEFLCESRLAVRRSRYAGPGRPEVEYRWSG